MILRYHSFIFVWLFQGVDFTYFYFSSFKIIQLSSKSRNSERFCNCCVWLMTNICGGSIALKITHFVLYSRREWVGNEGKGTLPEGSFPWGAKCNERWKNYCLRKDIRKITSSPQRKMYPIESEILKVRDYQTEAIIVKRRTELYFRREIKTDEMIF